MILSRMTEDKKDLFVIDQLRIQKSAHDERVSNNVSIEVNKKSIYLGSHYKIHYKEIDERTFDHQRSRLRQVKEGGHDVFFEFLLKASSDPLKPKFYLGVNNSKALNMLDRFISHVSHRYDSWKGKERFTEGSHEMLNKRLFNNGNMSTVQAGASKTIPPTHSKPVKAPSKKRQRSAYGSKFKTKMSLKQKIMSQSLNYDESEVDEEDEDEIEDPEDEPQRVHDQPTDSHMDQEKDYSKSCDRLSDQIDCHNDNSDMMGKVQLKKLKGKRNRRFDDDDDDEDVDFDQSTNHTQFKAFQSISDDENDENDDYQIGQVEDLQMKSNSTDAISRNQALITPMTATKSKQDKTAKMGPDTVNPLLTKDSQPETKKPKTTISNFFSKVIRPIENTKEETTKNTPKQQQQIQSPRRSPSNSKSSDFEELLEPSSSRSPFPLQTALLTPKRPPSQFQSSSIQVIKKNVRHIDMERQGSSGSHLTSFHSRSIPSVSKKSRDIDSEQHFIRSCGAIDLSSNENHELQKQQVHKFIGLRNLGNSCYLNAALQMLFSVKCFILDLERFYLAVKMASRTNESFSMPLTENLLDLARRMRILASDCIMDFTAASIDPTKLKKAVDNATDKFKGFQQKDAHEFAATFIDLLHEELITVSNGGVVPTDTYFLMKIEVSLTCDSCGYSRQKEEKYRHLSLDIEEVDPRSVNFSIQQGIQRFFNTEKIEVKCERCQEGFVATQSMKVISRPIAIILHMKRFIVSYQDRAENTLHEKRTEETEKKIASFTPSISKNQAKLSLNTDISVDSFKAPPEGHVCDTYCLRSVVHHVGPTASSGHYICDSVRLDIEDNSEKWVRFDDGLAKECSLSSLIEYEKNRGDAYMLMYTM